MDMMLNHSDVTYMNINKATKLSCHNVNVSNLFVGDVKTMNIENSTVGSLEQLKVTEELKVVDSTIIQIRKAGIYIAENAEMILVNSSINHLDVSSLIVYGKLTMRNVDIYLANNHSIVVQGLKGRVVLDDVRVHIGNLAFIYDHHLSRYSIRNTTISGTAVQSSSYAASAVAGLQGRKDALFILSKFKDRLASFLDLRKRSDRKTNNTDNIENLKLSSNKSVNVTDSPGKKPRLLPNILPKLDKDKNFKTNVLVGTFCGVLVIVGIAYMVYYKVIK